MKILCSWIFLAAYVHATRLHYSSPLLLTALQQQQLQRLQHPPATATTEYHDEDTLSGFYSYGYNDDNSAKAEFKSDDGSSKGFYSYVDTDGKLQTVEYVAGRELGFKASATNLPKAPVDNRRGPAPVKDTPEVQMAKKAHFEAYREAELRAALAGGDEEEGVVDQDRGENGLQVDQNNGARRGNDVLRSNLREQPNLLLLMANQNENQANVANDGRRLINDNRVNNDGGGDESVRDNKSENGRPSQMTTYRLQSNAAVAAPLRISPYSSTGLIGLGLHGLSRGFRTGHILPLLPTSVYAPAVHPTYSADSVPLSVHSYYTSPLATTSAATYRYHLSPTVLTTLPRLHASGTTSTITTIPEKPISEFLAHRLNLL